MRMRELAGRAFLALLFLLLPMVPATVARADGADDPLYDYFVERDGRAVLTRYLGQETDVVVPASIDGHPVSLTQGTFADDDAIVSVTFSEGIEVIGSDTCRNCTALQSVTIPDSVEGLGDYGFSDTALREVSLPEATEYIGIGCFYHCVDLRFVRVAAHELIIRDLAFADSGLELLEMPEDLEPEYPASAFTSAVPISTNPATSFLRLHEPLFSLTLFFFSLFDGEPLYIVDLLLFVGFFVVLTASVLVFVYLVVTVVHMASIASGKDQETLRDAYYDACRQSIQLSEDNTGIVYRDHATTGDRLKANATMFSIIGAGVLVLIAVSAVFLYLSTLLIYAGVPFIVAFLILALIVLLVILGVSFIASLLEARMQRGEATRASGIVTARQTRARIRRVW